MTEQEKREKVIRGLECYLAMRRGEKILCEMEYCPYWEEDDDTGMSLCNNYQILSDALTLLKAQEARVITLDEVDALGDDAIVWLECLYTIDGKNTTTLKPAIYQPKNSSPEEDGYYCVVSSWGQSGFYHKDDYMGGWRCWTSRPTDEQREAVPWLTT